MTGMWNPWHGCIKYSEGCAHCYMYRRDEMCGRDSTVTHKTAEFGLPVKRGRDGAYKIAPGSGVFACMTSDFFIDAADGWRNEAWDMMRLRSDVNFTVITKRVLRIRQCLPPDWGEGWDNITIAATIENQRRADERLDEFLDLSLKHRFVVCEPMLERIDMQKWLARNIVESVVAGGESGDKARTLDYEWVLDLRRQCAETGTRFRFKQTGARFLKDGKLYSIERKLQIPQAKKARIDVG